MDAVSTNQFADTLHFNDKAELVMSVILFHSWCLRTSF